MYLEIFKYQAKLLKAISHPKRLEIIHLIRDQILSVNQIQEMLNLPQANLSQHLMVLRDSEVVKTNKKGKYIYYSIANINFIKASDLIREVLIDRHKDSYLADEFAKKMSDLVPLVHDPVCKMRLSPKTASVAKRYKSNDYYFCASGCLEKFNENPIAYIK